MQEFMYLEIALTLWSWIMQLGSLCTPQWRLVWIMTIMRSGRTIFILLILAFFIISLTTLTTQLSDFELSIADFEDIDVTSARLSALRNICGTASTLSLSRNDMLKSISGIESVTHCFHLGFKLLVSNFQLWGFSWVPNCCLEFRTQVLLLVTYPCNMKHGYFRIQNFNKQNIPSLR